MLGKILIFLSLILVISLLWSRVRPQNHPRNQAKPKQNRKADHPFQGQRAPKAKPLQRTLVACPRCDTYYDPAGLCPHCK